MSDMTCAKRVFTSAVVAVLGALSPVVASAQCGSVAVNLVANCSFDLANPGSGPMVVYPNAVVSDWTSSDGLYERWTNGYDGFVSKDGNSHLELNVNSPTNLWQMLNTVAGETYQLDFSAAHRVLGNSYSQIDVWIDNAFLFSTGQMTTGFVWIDFSKAFEATGTSTKLEFRGMGNGGSYGNHLDNVSVVLIEATQQSVVPEPSTYALMAAGLAGLAAVGKRRRREV